MLPVKPEQRLYDKYMDRRKSTLGILPVLAAALLLSSCTKSTEQDMEITGTGSAIRFATPALTRAAVGSEDDLNKNGQMFSVWGGYRPTDGTGSRTQIFNGKTVTYTSGAGWAYKGGLHYWHSGNTYDFYAWYPTVVEISKAGSASTDDNGITYIDGFDATQGIDLMTAEKTDISVVAGQPEPPGAVELTFRHLLARVEIVGKAHSSLQDVENVDSRVVSAKLYGMSKKGDLDANANSLTTAEEIEQAWIVSNADADQSTQNSPFAAAGEAASEAAVTLTDEGVTVIDALLFPQEVAATGYVLEIEYATTAGDGAVTTTKPLDLGTLAGIVPKWEAGKHYRYTFTVTDGDRIAFDKPTVGTWSSATGGIIIVD